MLHCHWAVVVLTHYPRKLQGWVSGWRMSPCLEGLEAMADRLKTEIGLGHPFGSFVKEEEEGYHSFVANLVLVLSQSSLLC